MSDFHYNQLSVKDKKIYNSLLEAIGGRRDSFGVDTSDVRDVSRVFESFSFDHPEIFYVDLNNARLTITAPNTGKVELRYFYTPEETKRRKSAIETQMGRMIDDRAFANADTLEKVRLIHDRLVRTVTYNENAGANGKKVPDAFTIEGVFLRGSAVCEGISKAVSLLGQYLGLNMPVVKGEAAQDGVHYEPHAWNLVYFGGNCAHLDVTWDINLSTPLKFTRYDYFCLPDVDMRIDHSYGGLPACVHGRGLSFFERSHREFQDIDACKHFISEKLGEKSDVIYFKCVNRNTPPDVIGKRMDDAIKNMLRLRSLFMFNLEMSHNLQQGVFFYRVLKRL